MAESWYGSIMRASSRFATIAFVLFAFFAATSCSADKKDPLATLPEDIQSRVKSGIAALRLSDADRASIVEGISKNAAAFAVLFREALDVMKNDPYLLRRVDKTAALPSNYVPADLVSLDGKYPFATSKKNMQLRAPAKDALIRMAEAARAEGITLVVSSTYRSYAYQKSVFERNVKEMGKAEAERVSAPPGMSQHQLGTVIDFGSITDEFAATAQSRWLSSNAGKFGFSLSFPKGMEPVPGYKWESWHYRYISQPAAELQNRFFLGTQQYLIEFLSGLPR